MLANRKLEPLGRKSIFFFKPGTQTFSKIKGRLFTNNEVFAFRKKSTSLINKERFRFCKKSAKWERNIANIANIATTVDKYPIGLFA